MKKQNQIISLGLAVSLIMTSVIVMPVKASAQTMNGLTTDETNQFVQSMDLGYATNTDNNVWLTEIYPNDVDRSATYGNTSDLMEFVEVTNTGSEDISFNSGYGLYYEYPSGGSYVMKKLDVTDLTGNAEVTIKAGKSAIIWDQRTDVKNGPTEAQFRAAMNIPTDVQVYRCSGQVGFAESDRGFAIRKTDGTMVSYFRYTTAVDTADGLGVHLTIPDFGFTMQPYEQLKPTSAGITYSGQLNGRGTSTVPSITTPAGLFLTEIRPNDIDRSSQFGSGSNDVMECIELANTSDNDINLNKEYILNYVVKENSKTKLTISSVDRSSTDCIIPAHGNAVIWCDRQDYLVKGTSYTNWPTEEEFRAAYNIPTTTPVYVMTNQNGLNNTQRGFELSKINVDGSSTIVSNYFWDGVTDVVDGKSVDLKVSPGGPEMLVNIPCAATTMGIVSANQITYPPDDNSSPKLTLLDDTDHYTQGSFIRVPYNFTGTDIMPVTSIELYYKTSTMSSFTCTKTTAFAIYNKYYAFIPSNIVLNTEYVDYYLKAWNAYHVTMTDVRRLTNNKLWNTTGLNVRINNGEAADTQEVAGSIYISAKNNTDATQPVEVLLDGNELTTSRALESGAFYNFSYSGIDAYFKNALTCGASIIKLMAQCNEIPATSSMAVLVNGSYFKYNEDGSASVELTLRTGTYGSTWESDTAANNDDFTISNIALSLPDGSSIQPTTFENENGTALDNSSTIKMGDSSGCNIAAKAVFNIPANKINASGVTIDTTTLPEGEHTLIVKSGTETKTVVLNVDNVEDQQAEKAKVNYNMGLEVNAATASVSAINLGDTVSIYEAKALENMNILEGSGDSTAEAVTKAGAGITTSENGEFPYQIYEITTDGTEDESLRFDAQATSNYNRDVQLYALNIKTDKWEILDTHNENGVVSSVFPLTDRLKDQKVKVLIQARGTEYTPYTKEDTLKSVKNDASWDGTSVPSNYDFSFAWITDTQYYSEQFLANFDVMTDWILNNRSKYGIENVIHTGDIVDEFNEEYEFKNASGQLKKFDDAGMPYGVLAGNHDVAHGNERYDLYYKYFGENRYNANEYYGGSYKNNLGHYDLMTIDGQEMVLIYMSWDIYTQQVDWINQVLEKYSDRKAIICIHGGIDASANQSYFSDLLLDKVCKANKNVLAIINGHFHGSSMNFVGFDDNGDGINDRTVYQICTDYQSAPQGGQGYIKMIYFDLKNDKLYMNSYSPVLDDMNYYDNPKLSNYGAGVISKDQDIMELDVDFDTDTQKTLNVTKISANLLTNTVLGTSTTSDNTQVKLGNNIGDPKTVYAVEKDSKGNAVAYSALSDFTVDINSYNVSFNSQGGSVILNQSVKKGMIIAKPNAPVRSGYTFGGWFKEASCQGEWNFETDTISTDTILYAKWIEVLPQKATESNNNQGGAAVSVPIQSVAPISVAAKADAPDVNVKGISLNKVSLLLGKGKKATLLTTATPTNASNKSVKWVSSNTKVATVDSKGIVKAVGYGKTKITAKAANGSGVVSTYNISVGYQIKYVLNGGKNNKINPAFYYKTQVILKNATKKGYQFVGWYSDKKFKKKVTAISKSNAKNITLYAKWKRK